MRVFVHTISRVVASGLAFSVLLHAAGTIPDTGIELAAVLERTRAALGVQRLRAFRHPLRLHGRATLNGIEGQYSLTYSSDDRFIQEFRGAISSIQAHDGETTWLLQPTGASVEAELADQEMVLTSLWIQTGYWLDENAPLEIRLNRRETDALTVVLDIAFAGGIYSGILAIDRESGLPSSWSSVEMGRRILTRFERYRKRRGVKVPTRIIVSIDGNRHLYAVVDEIDNPRNFCVDVYARREDPQIGVRFIDEGPAQLEVTSRGRGHLFIRPRLNGREAGWFLFDTGSAGTILSDKLATKLGLETLGTTASVGVGGQLSLFIAKLDRLQLGRLDMRNVPVGVMDLGALAHQTNLEMSGIIGNNVIGRAVVEYDLSVPRVAIYDPARYELEFSRWQPLQMSSGKPVARIRFEGHQGFFTMDTAASSGLLIHAPTVARHRLLEGRQTRRSMSFGVGGPIRLQAGHLEWVEFGGRRFDNLPVLFATEEKGTGADRLRDGIVGMELMRHFRIVFDYTHRRIALLQAGFPAGSDR